MKRLKKYDYKWRSKKKQYLELQNLRKVIQINSTQMYNEVTYHKKEFQSSILSNCTLTTVCCYHVTYTFQSESSLYSC